MNVFLPYERNLTKSVQCLDDLRLNKQILECLQLLNTYVRSQVNHEEKVGYRNHPVYKHFSSTSYNLYALMKYAIESCIEYKHRFDREHKLYVELISLRTRLFNYPENIDYLYQPYYMRGSLGQPEYIRTTENVSELFQQRLVQKWSQDKRQPRWTNREEPIFWRNYKENDKSTKTDETR